VSNITMISRPFSWFSYRTIGKRPSSRHLIQHIWYCFL